MSRSSDLGACHPRFPRGNIGRIGGEAVDSLSHRQFMERALDEARRAYEKGEVPVGAVIVDSSGDILAQAHNLTVSTNDPTAHAELLAIRQAAAVMKNYRLTHTSLYVTVEPCCMCAGAMVWARIGRLIYGTADTRGGAAGSLYRIPEDSRLNHRMEVVSGVGELECRTLIRQFFQERR